jgi:potassium efflux system protein
LPPHITAPDSVRPNRPTTVIQRPSEASPKAVSATPSKEASASANDAPDIGDSASERTAVQGRLKDIPIATAKEATDASKAVREVLEERLKWLDEWEKAVKERQAAEHPKPSPEEQAVEWKDDLERVTAALSQASKDPDAVLPASFRNLPTVLPDKARAEMKEAIDAAQNELRDRSSKLDSSKKDGAGLAAIRARRDKTHQRLAGLKARSLERETALAAAKTTEARALARDRLVNALWESRVEDERLRGLEALIVLEGKRSEMASLNLQVLNAHVQLAQRTLDHMKERFRTLTAREERDLQRAATEEKSRAKKADDPVERYRAKRSAELFELRARVLDLESLLATSPSPSLEEQRRLADRAQTDFTDVKKLLDDGKVSHLDALKLNNDFRRIGAERARIVRNELAVVTSRMTGAANALSAIEMEMIYASRDDRYELDGLLERISKSQHARAIATFDELEQKYLALLTRRRDALQKLANRAEETNEQIERRLRILDDHFGFIRTNIFWVRDEEPIGQATLLLAHREAIQLARSAVRMAEEVGDRSAWVRVSPEFLAAVLGLAILPWPLHKARLAVRRRRAPREGAALDRG